MKMKQAEFTTSRSCRENPIIPKRDSSGPKFPLGDDRVRVAGNPRRERNPMSRWARE